MARLLGPVEVRSLCTEMDVRPTKKLGQNFVHDPNTVRRIVAAAALSPDDVALEVGPGLGSLTLALLPEVRAVVAIELDPVLAERLPTTVGERANEFQDRLHVLHRDALRVHRDELPVAPTALVANLPYNVAVPVVLHLLAQLPQLHTVLVMVQAEVADRMVSAPGGRIYGVPSAKIAWYAKAERAGAVPRAVFWPVPNVDSGLVRLTRRPEPVADRAATFAVVDAAFAQRRKTLRAALAGWAGTASEAERRLRGAGIDPSLRGEQLSINDFAAIATQGASTEGDSDRT